MTSYNACELGEQLIYVLMVSKGVISSGELYCCLLPQCEALRICRSGFPIATVAKSPQSHCDNKKVVNCAIVLFKEKLNRKKQKCSEKVVSCRVRCSFDNVDYIIHRLLPSRSSKAANVDNFLCVLHREEID